MQSAGDHHHDYDGRADDHDYSRTDDYDHDDGATVRRFHLFLAVQRGRYGLESSWDNRL